MGQALSPPQYTLTVSKTGTGNGTVTSSPSGITCGTDCTESYNDGTTVTLTANQDANFSFTGWSGACTGTGTCTVTMNNQKNVNADFQLNYSDISISPTSYSFANVKINTTSPSKVFTITNAGKASLVISSVTISGTNAGEFTQTNNCTTVGVGSSCTINVNFKPTSEGAKNATLTISSNDPDTSTINVSLSGTGIESASGIWRGSFTSNGLHKTSTILGVITENGEGRFLSDEGAQFTGNVSVNGSSFTSTATAFAPYVFVDGSNYGTVQFNGTVKTKYSLTGTYSGVGDYGTFNLTYDSIYERGSSLSWVSGNWANSDSSGYSHYVTVSANGTLTGYNSYGCTFSGNVTIINPSYDAYRLYNVSISSCQGQSSVFNGTYNGLGVLSTTNDTFTIGISNSYASMVLTFRRQ